MVYQLMFAIITPALISGAFAERMKFSAMLLFMMLWALLVYFPMAHMVWGKGGFLNAFLGGKVPCFRFRGRHGRAHHLGRLGAGLRPVPGQAGRLSRAESMKPHSLVLSFIGACLLWVGWFGFNAGSALGASGLATSAFVATHFGAAAAALGWMGAEWMQQRQAERARRHFGLRRGAGGHYACIGLRETLSGAADRILRRRRLLLDGDQGEKQVRL